LTVAVSSSHLVGLVYLFLLVLVTTQKKVGPTSLLVMERKSSERKSSRPVKQRRVFDPLAQTQSEAAAQHTKVQAHTTAKIVADEQQQSSRQETDTHMNAQMNAQMNAFYLESLRRLYGSRS
jgi:uncharacterized protein with NRDE domain